MSLCGEKDKITDYMEFRRWVLVCICMGFQWKAFKYSDNDNVKAIKRKEVFLNCATRRSHCPTKNSLIFFICDCSE